ncbi:membrane alanyl aminopeptidase-like [Vanessa atalanta]|uniref:membrane alanyl aminopeptidase-like n=1 Tax=Vanessa atalanta TaxID=42275 RepID=UPI001FCCCCFD|nr:membrane alanyl aminopeptidase-like [Vanessa atalanta]
MARTKFKWLLIIYLSLIISNDARSIPILQPLTLQTTDSVYPNVIQETPIETIETLTKDTQSELKEVTINGTRDLQNESLMRSNVRPGQEVRRYTVEIKRNDNVLEGRAVIDVQLTEATRNNPILFNAIQLTVTNVLVGVLTSANAVAARFRLVNQQLEITPAQSATSYVVIVEYTMALRDNGFGLYMGKYQDTNYIAMNLYPTHARRVFPCMDEPNLSTITTFTFENMGYENIITNAMTAPESQTTFRALEGPPYLWGMVAHDFRTVVSPATNVHLYVRQGVSNQENLAATAIHSYYLALNEWTQKPYTEIIANQDGRMHVLALPDVSQDWYALSTVCIWEPYVLTENTGSALQRKLVVVNIAEAMSKQWFGYVLYPENWRHQWIVSGLSSYAGHSIAKAFQTNPEDTSLIDMDAIFVTDIIQESLLRDSFENSQPLEPADNIFVENRVRLNINGVLKYKAPAMLRMFRLILGDDETDVIQRAARALLTSRSLQPINLQNFYDSIISELPGENLVDSNIEFMQNWLTNNGYPLINVRLHQNGVVLSQQRFGLTVVSQVNYLIPISYTTSVNPNFDDIKPEFMMDTTHELNFALEDDDWVIFNLQGQGYYRVNYDDQLWDRIIAALEDPETREIIHPFNRASLLDDSLNLARAGRLDYDIAFRIALTMEHELDYSVWRSFVRNMDFLRKRLFEMDEEVYVRMVRRTIPLFEEELGFVPSTANEPAMDRLTRGLVMDHACRSGYDPCIAAAVDLFYDPNDNEAVNPSIPSDIRPAVYCTMVKVGDEGVIDALRDRLEIEPVLYERVVILESLGCSDDEEFIKDLLQETVAATTDYTPEERMKIFAAVASSSFQNSWLALEFLTTRAGAIRNMYGGTDKLDEAIFIMADNILNEEMASDFNVWVNSLDSISNLGDSSVAATEARRMIAQNIIWNNNLKEQAYDWINTNNAPTIFISTFLVTLSLLITLINY